MGSVALAGGAFAAAGGAPQGGAKSAGTLAPAFARFKGKVYDLPNAGMVPVVRSVPAKEPRISAPLHYSTRADAAS